MVRTQLEGWIAGSREPIEAMRMKVAQLGSSRDVSGFWPGLTS